MRARPLALAFAPALALVVLAPAALALDAFPAESRFAATEARILVRLPAGGHLRVETEPPTMLALADAPGGAIGDMRRAPLDANVTPESAARSWHGLAGTVEVALHRDDPAQAIEIVAEDERGGAVFDWPAQPGAAARGIGAPGVLAALGIAAVAAVLWKAHHAK